MPGFGPIFQHNAGNIRSVTDPNNYKNMLNEFVPIKDWTFFLDKDPIQVEKLGN